MLTSLHKNTLVTTFVHIESRLREVELLLGQNERPSPLSEHDNDLSPTELKTITDYFARIRSTMLNCLEKHRVPIEVHRVSLRRVLRTRMYSLGIALAELGPERLRGYGELGDAGNRDMQSIQHDLDWLEVLLDKVAAICGG